MSAQLNYNIRKQELEIVLAGDFIQNKVPHDELLPAINKVNHITFSAGSLKSWDSSLVVILFELAKTAQSKGAKIDWSGLPTNLQEMISLALTSSVTPPTREKQTQDFLTTLGEDTLNNYNSLKQGLSFIKSALGSFARLLGGKAIMRKVDFLFALEGCGYKAVGIVSVVSFMVGLILAYVGSIQLKNFGAQIYVASLVAIGMTRIMGAIMAGIVMAGRTGAAYAATIGTMQVNEEIDALKTMGLSPMDFLVLPRISALILAMPFLTLLSDIMGILGGAVVGVFTLGIPYESYWEYTWDALFLKNFWVGIFHGFVYGWIISICGGYYGINCGRNADSVGVATTKAVVSSIVWMIVITGVLTVILQEFHL